jgi:hypothetical protein
MLFLVREHHSPYSFVLIMYQPLIKKIYHVEFNFIPNSNLLPRSTFRTVRIYGFPHCTCIYVIWYNSHLKQLLEHDSSMLFLVMIYSCRSKEKKSIYIFVIIFLIKLSIEWLMATSIYWYVLSFHKYSWWLRYI